MTIDEENPLLAPCSRFDKRYENLLFKSNNFTDWPKEYHDKVQEVVEEHLKFPSKKVECSSGDFDSFLQPQPKLRQLANNLLTWNGSNSPTLRQTDIGLVLMEYLNIYECVLKERYFFLSYDSQELMKQNMSEGENAAISYPQVIREMENELSLIRGELGLARKTLTRTLAVISGMNRIIPLDLELQCMAGASMDIRNATALAAEAGACLPRIWNAKDPFRDLKDTP